MSTPSLKLGIPGGSLQEATAELFRKAGWNVSFASRCVRSEAGVQEVSALHHVDQRS
jgi:ATP phosphoribosyltransferase